MPQQAAGAAAALCQLPPALFASTSLLSMYRTPAMFVHMSTFGSQQTCLVMIASKMRCPVCGGLLMALVSRHSLEHRPLLNAWSVQ